MLPKNNQGFLLISILLAIAIVVILFVVLNRPGRQAGSGGNENVVESGQRGADSLKNSQQKLMEQQNQTEQAGN